MVSFFFLSSPTHPGSMYLSFITYGLFLSAVALTASMVEFHVFIFAIGEWITMHCSELCVSQVFLAGILLLAGILFGAVFTLFSPARIFRAPKSDVAVQTDFSTLVSTLHLPDQLYASRKGACFHFREHCAQNGSADISVLRRCHTCCRGL